jgi:hypothetical protein
VPREQNWGEFDEKDDIERSFSAFNLPRFDHEITRSSQWLRMPKNEYCVNLEKEGRSMNKIYFITGASSGFGRALAEEVLSRGDSAILAARRTEALDELAHRFPQTALAVALDVTDEAARRRAVEAALQKFGRVDVLVNNAGQGSLGAMEEFSSSQIRAQMEVNFFGAVELTLALLPSMRERKSGAHPQRVEHWRIGFDGRFRLILRFEIRARRLFRRSAR